MSGVPQILILAGTSYLYLVNFMAMYPNSIFILVDAQVELEALKLTRSQRKSVHQLSLGSGLTVQQLSALHFSPSQKDAISKIPNMSMEDGLAQVAGFGRAAMTHLIGQRETEEFINGLSERLISMSGGELDSALLKLYCGTSGGAGSLGGFVLFNHVVDTLIRQSSVNIHADIHLLGPITYTDDRFPRTQFNAATSTATWLHHSLHSRQDRLTMTFFLREVPAVGVDRAKRSDFMLDQDQSFSSPVVSEHIDTIRTNQAANGSFGNLLLPRFDHFQRISRDSAAADIAADYIPDLESLLETPAASGRIAAIYFEHESDDDVRLATEEIVSACRETDDIEPCLELVGNPLAITATLVVELVDGTQIPITPSGKGLGAPITSLKSAREHIALLRAIQASAESESAAVDADAVELLKTLEKAERSCRRGLYCVRRSNRLGKRGSTFQKAIEAADDLRDHAQFLQEAEAERSAIAFAQSAVDRELNSQLKRFETLLTMLEDVGVPASHASDSPRVIPVPLTNVLSDLVATVELPQLSELDFLKTLTRCVGSVTLFGLKEISGSRYESIDAVVETVKGIAPTRGPSWGGKRRLEKSKRFLVYPHVERNLALSLHQQHDRQQDPDYIVAFAHPESHALNIVGLEFRDANQMEDVLTPYLMDGIGKSCSDPLSPFYLQDVSILKALSVRLTQADANP